MFMTVQGCAGFAQTLHTSKPNKLAASGRVCRVCRVPRTHTRVHFFNLFISRTEFIYLLLSPLETLLNPAHPAHPEQVYKSKRYFDAQGLCSTLQNPARRMK